MSRDHYVSQFYLRQFEIQQTGEHQRHELFVHDRQGNELDPPKKLPIRRILQKEGLFTFTGPDGFEDRRLEDWFAKIESKVGPVLKKMMAPRVDASCITDEEWSDLFFFMCMQYVRSDYEDIWLKVDNTEGLDRHQKEKMFANLLGSIGMGLDPNTPSFAHFLGEKPRMVFSIEQTERSFITSDRPVTIPYRTGVALDHCLIFLPLGSKRLIMASKIPYLPDSDLVNRDIGGFVSLVNRIIANGSERFIVGGDQEELIIATSRTPVRPYRTFLPKDGICISDIC